MKKLIYTLLLGLTIVACDKGDDVMDIQSVTPQEIAAIDVSVSPDALIDARFNAFNSFLRGAKFKDSSKNTSANKGGDNGADWIELIWFQHTSDNYVYTRPEDLGNSCSVTIGEGVTNPYRETYSYRADTQMVNIQIGDATGGERAIPADLQPLYAAAFANTESSIFFANLESSIWSFREGATPSVTVID